MLTAADRSLVRKANLARRFRRVRAGKHPYFAWGATSGWTVWGAIVRRTMTNYIRSIERDLYDDLARHQRLSGIIHFLNNPGPGYTTGEPNE